MAVGPLLQLLLSATGWRHTLQIFAALLLVPTLAALAYCVPESRNKKEKEANLPKPKIKIVDFSVLKNPAFMVLCVAMSTFMLGYFVPFVHVVSFPTFMEELQEKVPKICHVFLRASRNFNQSELHIPALTGICNLNKVRYNYPVIVSVVATIRTCSLR